MAGKTEEEGTGVAGALPIRLFDDRGLQKAKVGRRYNTFDTQKDFETALDAVGVRGEYDNGQNGRYVFNFDPDPYWHRHYPNSVRAGNAARVGTDSWDGGLRVALIDGNGHMLRFKENSGKDDIASALRLFKGDVAAAAEYLKGQQ